MLVVAREGFCVFELDAEEGAEFEDVAGEGEMLGLGFVVWDKRVEVEEGYLGS